MVDILPVDDEEIEDKILTKYLRKEEDCLFLLLSLSLWGQISQGYLRTYVRRYISGVEVMSER